MGSSLSSFLDLISIAGKEFTSHRIIFLSFYFSSLSLSLVFIFLKDFFGFILILCLYFLQTHFHISSLSHPDNALEACALLTPLHIVPEWYFLCQYAILKAMPNKNAGFIVLLTSIFTFFFFGEIRNLTTFCLLNNNGFSLSSFFLVVLTFLWNLDPSLKEELSMDPENVFFLLQ